ncbi:MAG: hypothetical protein M3N47_12055, partial [Chloroflexota bacterium]|nr:hypothetical protein [Chloroflexota bacterium]
LLEALAPRVDAARGLLALGRTPGILSEDALDKVRGLAADPASAVRMTCASELRWLRDTDQPLAWTMVEQLARTDPSSLVQRQLLRSLGVLAHIDRDRALDLAAEMHAREADRPEPRVPLLADIGGFLIEVSVWTGTSHGNAILDRMTADIAARQPETQQILFRLREVTTVGEPGNLDDSQAVRGRALRVFEQLLAAAVDAFDEIVDEALTPTRLDLDAGQAQRFRAVAEMIDNVATEIYFASGAHVDQSEARRPRLEEPKRRRFYHEAAALLDMLTRVRWPASAVHHVLKTLQEQVAFDPRGVLLRIGRLVRSARTWGYQNDPLAHGAFVEIVQTYLTTHRKLLVDEQARQALLDSLDAFVDAGWPAARRLVYRLDEAFR